MENLRTLRALIGSDATAITFQSMAQYREFLLSAIEEMLATAEPSVNAGYTSPLSQGEPIKRRKVKMAKHKLEFDEKCKSCNGTGLYAGMGERDGAAVVCHTCKGTGCHHVVIEYEDFEGRVDRDDVLHVVEVNPGICIGTGNGHSFWDFGGMSYDDWKAGKPFVAGMENRKYTCPCRWYQSADYKKKPEWNECNDALGRTFSHCPHFATKEKCWGRFDSEQEAV